MLGPKMGKRKRIYFDCGMPVSESHTCPQAGDSKISGDPWDVLVVLTFAEFPVGTTSAILIRTEGGGGTEKTLGKHPCDREDKTRSSGPSSFFPDNLVFGFHLEKCGRWGWWPPHSL